MFPASRHSVSPTTNVLSPRLGSTTTERLDPVSTTLQDDDAAHDPTDDGVEANSRLTASTGAIIFVLLAAEGVTVLSVHSLLRLHVIIGMVLVPVVLLKVTTTTYPRRVTTWARPRIDGAARRRCCCECWDRSSSC